MVDNFAEAHDLRVPLLDVLSIEKLPAVIIGVMSYVKDRF
jgi:hypothetical protein